LTPSRPEYTKNPISRWKLLYFDCKNTLKTFFI
jgi:hypothetical protein